MVSIRGSLGMEPILASTARPHGIGMHGNFGRARNPRKPVRVDLAELGVGRDILITGNQTTGHLLQLHRYVLVYSYRNRPHDFVSDQLKM